MKKVLISLSIVFLLGFATSFSLFACGGGGGNSDKCGCTADIDEVNIILSEEFNKDSMVID